jgi:trk system potassium uptake protein TrkH
MRGLSKTPPPLNKIRQRLHPLQKIVLSFIGLILTGSVALLLPFSSTGDISYIDALFTATSAVCVTGLIVLDTAKDFTIFGKTIIALLIQMGGLGVMTVSIALLSFIKGNYSMRWRFTFENLYSDLHTIPIRALLKRILLYTGAIELVVATILFVRFLRHFPPLEALGHALFHAISAFCNAGFSSFSDNLKSFGHDGIVLAVVSLAVILGGLGFLVLTEITGVRPSRKSAARGGYSLHTRLVLVMTVLLLAYGMGAILLLEWNHALAHLSPGQKLATSFFHSMSSRTAGFNTIDIASLRESTLFSLIALMFIGGSPGSIAGGIKTTTIAAIAGLVYARIRNRKEVVFWKRSLGQEAVDRATTLIILSGLFVYITTFSLLFLGSFDLGHSFISVVFEVTSAFGTVGLSTGIPSQLLDEGNALSILVMCVGRLGPFVLIAALSTRSDGGPLEYPQENIMIG